MGFSRQEYWSGLPFPPPEYLSNPGVEPMSPVSPALQVDSLLLEPLGKPHTCSKLHPELKILRMELLLLVMLLLELFVRRSSRRKPHEDSSRWSLTLLQFICSFKCQATISHLWKSRPLHISKASCKCLPQKTECKLNVLMRVNVHEHTKSQTDTPDLTHYFRGFRDWTLLESSSILGSKLRELYLGKTEIYFSIFLFFHFLIST